MPEDNKVYKIVNVSTGTVLDLDGSNKVTGRIDKGTGAKNQQWKLEKSKSNPAGNEWDFKNVEHGQFLGIGGNFDVVQGSIDLQGVSQAVGWTVDPSSNDFTYLFNHTLARSRSFA